jgi:hypothetical protein
MYVCDCKMWWNCGWRWDNKAIPFNVFVLICNKMLSIYYYSFEVLHFKLDISIALQSRVNIEQYVSFVSYERNVPKNQNTGDVERFEGVKKSCKMIVRI